MVHDCTETHLLGRVHVYIHAATQVEATQEGWVQKEVFQGLKGTLFAGSRVVNGCTVGMLFPRVSF